MKKISSLFAMLLAVIVAVVWFYKSKNEANTISSKDALLYAEKRLSEGDQKQDIANHLFESYLHNRGADEIERVDYVEKIRSMGERLKQSNRNSVLSLIKSPETSKEERLSLIRLYGDQVEPGVRGEVVDNIMSLLDETTDQEIGRTIALSISRKLHPEISDDWLKKSFSLGFLSDDDYFGEIAHNIPMATEYLQRKWIDELARSKNNYSQQIVFSKLATGELQASGSNIQALQHYLENSEPQFPEEPGRFGLFSSFSYQNWLESMSRLSAEKSGTDSFEYIESQLTSDNVDPRKILSYLLEEKNLERVIQKSNESSRHKLAMAIMKYSTEHPTNSVVEAVQVLYPKLMGFENPSTKK